MGGGHVLQRLRAWWQRGGGLDMLEMEPREIERVAEDVRLTAPELRGLVARGPHAADELIERMRVLGIGKDDVEAIAPGLLRDLQRTCAACNVKGVCRRDLAQAPDDPRWEGYCPNASGLTCVKVAKAHAPV
jgi:hypothetical protein